MAEGESQLGEELTIPSGIASLRGQLLTPKGTPITPETGSKMIKELFERGEPVNIPKNVGAKEVTFAPSGDMILSDDAGGSKDESELTRDNLQALTQEPGAKEAVAKKVATTEFDKYGNIKQ